MKPKNETPRSITETNEGIVQIDKLFKYLREDNIKIQNTQASKMMELNKRLKRFVEWGTEMLAGPYAQDDRLRALVTDSVIVIKTTEGYLRSKQNGQ